MRKITNIRKSMWMALILALMIFSSVFASAAVAEADAETFDTRVVIHAGDCRYMYFDFPSTVYSSGNKFTVADGLTAYTFDADNPSKAPAESELPERGITALSYFGDTAIYLASEGLTVGDALFEGAIDFAHVGNTLYYIDGDASGTVYAVSLSTADEDASFVPVAIATCNSSLSAIAADDNGIYVSKTNSLNGYLRDILFLRASAGTLAAPVVAISGLGKIHAMAGRTDGIAVLGGDGIAAYDLRGDGTLARVGKIACTDAVSLSSFGDTIYGITELKSIFKIDGEFTERKELIASAGNHAGFFRMNAKLTTRKNVIAVADEYNDRVQIISDNATEIISEGLARPKAVAIDYAGNIYVAHSDCKITVFDGNTFTVLRSYSADNLSLTVVDLKIDADNELYALGSSGQVYKATSLPFTPIGEANCKAISTSQKDNEVFVATLDNKIARLGESAAVVSCTQNITDFCVDHNGSFYILTDGGEIAKYEPGATRHALLRRPSAPFANATAIEMNTVKFVGDVPLSYGDILVSDTDAHAVLAIAGDDLNTNEGFVTSDKAQEVSGEKVPLGEGGEIIFTVHASELYPQAAEINALSVSLGEDMKVILPDYDDTANFNYLVADNLAGTDAPQVTGYLHKSFIKSKIPYAAPKVSICYSFTGVKVYKYPTYNSPVVAEHGKDTRYGLLDFAYTDDVYGYTDNRGTMWYRVSYAEGDARYEGYVNGKFIRLRGGIPNDNNVYPRTNATIISLEKGKNIPATLFEMDDGGNITEIREDAYPPLPVGAKVEVVGAFDTSEEFTLINYYHEGMGKTVQLYVYTANLDYDGINVAVIVAILLIILTLILGAILIARIMYVKRNNKLNKETKV